MPEHRTREELEHAVRAVARHFHADEVVVVGSQAILVGWPRAPVMARVSAEFDLYPANNRKWERQNPELEASEEINALFGEGSVFHGSYGYYIDGVDEKTARLPPDWRDGSEVWTIEVDNRQVRVVAPALDDLIASKLYRLSAKDERFVAAAFEGRCFDSARIVERLKAAGAPPAVLDRARNFLTNIERPARFSEPAGRPDP